LERFPDLGNQWARWEDYRMCILFSTSIKSHIKIDLYRIGSQGQAQLHIRRMKALTTMMGLNYEQRWILKGEEKGPWSF
jgi:hypothetical protein